ncbi:MAG: DNA repair protein RecN [Hellea sp.]|nr:DNA repair protein RecN [Hellea sp.]
MLSELSIRNVVLIEALDLEFQRGMTALTGETGAGKSIILDALSMATGARSDKALVRKGCEKAQCIASFDLPVDHQVWEILQTAEFEHSPQESLVLRRLINADGRSKAFINDSPVSVKLLARIGAILLEVHGQHDGRGLLDPTQHIFMLDRFGGYSNLVANVRDLHGEKQAAELALAELKAKAEQASIDRDFLSYAVEELDRLDVRSGEEDELAARRRFLQGSEGALSELANAAEVLDQSDYESRLATALSGIERVRDKIGEGDKQASAALIEAGAALEKALLETQEARRAVGDAAGNFETEPGELDRTEERLFAIKAACRKYVSRSETLIDRRREFAESLALIENMEKALGDARKTVEGKHKAYDAAATRLTEAREKAARRLEKSVLKELPDLKMERAQFTVGISEGADSALGRDKVRFQVATNPGSAMGPMDKVASGGELARFSLAIKVALADGEEQVLVFDEVDQGVGGAVASAVGQRLSKLTAHAQVFIVTHSPQVAACANHQYRIEKASKAKTTLTSVIAVAANEREEEIARMLAGEIITDEARAAARQLMKAS